MTRNRLAAALGAGMLAAFGTACIKSQQRPQRQAAPPPQTVPMELVRPTFTLVQPADPAITQEGITISIQPVAYEWTERTKVLRVEQTGVHEERRPNPSGNQFDPDVFVERPLFTITRGPKFHLQPEQPTFLVKVNNAMGKVFRMAGAVILYQVNGRQLAVPQERYVSVLGALVPPRGESELQLRGPEGDPQRHAHP